MKGNRNSLITGRGIFAPGKPPFKDGEIDWWCKMN
jgi:hypothetical protein